MLKTLMHKFVLGIFDSFAIKREDNSTWWEMKALLPVALQFVGFLAERRKSSISPLNIGEGTGNFEIRQWLFRATVHLIKS